MILVEFKDKLDKNRVLRNAPWNFDKCLILLKEYDGKKKVCNLSIFEAMFWIRIYNLPFMARNIYIDQLIGNSLGLTEKIDLKEGNVGWGEYMRTRVRLYITKSLVRRKWLTIDGLDTFWVGFTYENLPNFCFSCGPMGHGLNECSVSMSSKEKVLSLMVIDWERHQEELEDSILKNHLSHCQQGIMESGGVKVGEATWQVVHGEALERISLVVQPNKQSTNKEKSNGFDEGKMIFREKNAVRSWSRKEWVAWF